MQTYRVLLVEDRNIYKLYFEQLLHASGRYELIGTEADMKDALQFCSYTSVDLIVTEAADRNGTTCFQALVECRRKYSHIRSVVITDSVDRSFLERAEECGADSFWYAEDRQVSLLSVLDRTMEGKSVFPAQPPAVKIGQMESRNFSAKELQILREVAKGYSNKEIAESMQMSYYTVRDYVKGMLEKTHLQNRTELAVAAAVSGLIFPEKREKNSVM